MTATHQGDAPETDNPAQPRPQPNINNSTSPSSNDPIINLTTPKPKPSITRPITLLTNAQELQARLASFLPRLAAANEELARQDHGRNMEEVEDGERHIEMNLGLGVLEERGSSESEEESGSEVESDDESDEEGGSKDGTSEKRMSRKSDVMDKLMGQKGTKQKVAIEEVG